MPKSITNLSIVDNEFLVNLILTLMGYIPCPVCHQTGALLYWSDGAGCMCYEPCAGCDGSGRVTVAEAKYYDEVEEEIPF